ncbi:CorA family divalent cation transporter [Sunxiuqinia sp. A32]|uniref:CorA family divalent cation transporter n=1 Tax=Sunxiuqinia sp. A32 TaxID=3461496 RepID=UPI0040457656
MLEIILKNKEIIKAKNTDELSNVDLDFNHIHFIDYTESDIKWVQNKFGLDFSIMQRYEDIEISSHFLENENQASFHFSIPFYNDEKKLVEEPIFLIMSSHGLFLFSSSDPDEFFNRTYANKFKWIQEISDLNMIFKTQIEFITDYYADITENLTKRIKSLANRVLIEKEFTKEDMDVITRYNFNNLLIKESLIETTRVFNLYKKSKWEQKIGIKETIERELNDLTVVSDYIQFNFDRLDDLKENVTNKIDLEQNHIFKMLTVVTVCISLPTLIAGVYGMNFEKMPELKTAYGYPIVLIAMVFSVILPLIYFKRKKWF